MNQYLSFRSSPRTASAILLAGVVALFLFAYALARIASAGEVMGRVEVADVGLGGLDPDMALGTMVEIEDRFTNRTAIFSVEGSTVQLPPPEVGLDIDETAVVEGAMEVGRSGNPIGEFFWWLTHIFAKHKIPLQGSLQPELLELTLVDWEANVIANPTVPGGIVLIDGEPAPVYPETGTGIDRVQAEPEILRVLLATQPQVGMLETEVIQPALTDAQVDEALLIAQELLSAPIIMTDNGTTLTVDSGELKKAFVAKTIREAPARIELGFDPAIIDEFLDPIRSDFETQPVNAEFRIEGDAISIIPSSNGTEIDSQETANRLYVAGTSPTRAGVLPLVDGAAPDVTTEYLESLNVNHLVSQFTTYHDCCAVRVINIHQIADDVDMTLVLPGETFSLNGHVGERTEAGGYVAAGTIVAGEIEDTIGGGVSQFTTTMYNAVFWGGYEDVEHKAHSYYFSRYPEGVEATLNWRTPDLKFRNNRDHAILIDTRYTDTSITVRFFGDNDGRTLKGEQSGGTSKVWVDKSGGTDARHVKGSVSERFAITVPGEPKYEANPELDPETMNELQSAADGWSVRVTRRILVKEVEVENQEWVVRYAPRFAVFEVHPCMMPGSTEVCPTTTTLPTTTTTLPPATTPPTTPD
ncbi:MAG: VanW family protein [Acidimicrobiia bacterium]|nr:VanW family protein [Acidimicrobiia bacterium]MDH3463753.1 VanW family protein [Acidimicrobiia bacterium]